MNYSYYSRAVAAATGRRFKSSRPDVFFKGMTRTILFTFAALVSLTLSARAQELAPSAVDLTTKPAERNPAAATPTPTPASELPDLPELSQLDEIFKQTSLGKTADEFRVHIEWRRLRNRVANDPEVIAARKAADAAHTDLEKRQRVRRYYDVYYTRMQALADRPEIKAALEAMKTQHVGLADQNHVRPSPSPSATATPAAEAVGEAEERPSPGSPSPSPSAPPSPGESAGERP